MMYALMLQGKGRKVLEQKRTAENPAVYRWKIERKR
jgi:hypothetical protein